MACSSLMTTGNQWRPLAPLLGAHAIRARWRQRSPTGASWRQLAPVGARGCQRVPGGSGFNWRSLALTGAHWRPVAPLLGTHAYATSGASGRQLAPVGASWRQLAPVGARGCQGVLASIGAHWRSMALTGEQLRSRSSVEVNCRSKQRFFDLTPQDCIFRSRNQRLRRGLGWVFG